MKITFESKSDTTVDWIKVHLWKFIKPFRWRVLWFVHDKFIIGVVGIIFDNKNNVLLLRHRYWPKDSWGLPSGYAEHGEKLEDALAREVQEETGYEIKVGKMLYLKSGYRLRLVVAYLGQLKGERLEINTKEIIDAKFFPLNKMPKGLLDLHKVILAKAKIFLKKLK